MRTILRTVLVCLIVPVAALSQEPPKASIPASQENPLSTWNKMAYGRVKAILLRSAEKMPEENYNFKPTDTVRSYGQIIGHVADAQYLFCSVALGEKNPDLKIEQTKTSKADLIAAVIVSLRTSPLPTPSGRDRSIRFSGTIRALARCGG